MEKIRAPDFLNRALSDFDVKPRKIINYAYSRTKAKQNPEKLRGRTENFSKHTALYSLSQPRGSLVTQAEMQRPKVIDTINLFYETTSFLNIK